MTGIIDGISGWLGRHLSRDLSKTIHVRGKVAPADPVKPISRLDE